MFILLGMFAVNINLKAGYDPSKGRFLKRDPIDEKGFQLLHGRRGDGIRGSVEPYTFVKNNPICKWDELGLKIFVVRRPLTAFTSWWSAHLTKIGFVLGGVSGAYLGKVAKYYRNTTSHCSLVVSCSTGKNKSKSINSKGNLVDMKDVKMTDTWDFQANGAINNPAADWDKVINPKFPSNYYKGRKSIDVIVDDDSKDAALLKILNSEPKKQKYVLGGSKRYNCCDWISKVLKKIGKNYTNPNPKPFGEVATPWWVPDKTIGKIIDQTQ